MESRASDLKALRILFIALLSGQLIFGGIGAFLVNRGFASNSDPSMARTFLIIAGIAAFLLVSASYLSFRKRLRQIRTLSDLSAQLPGYRAACLTKWGLAEAPYLFSILAYLMCGQHWLLLLAGLLLLNFIYNFPSKDRIIRDLQLSSQDESQID